MSKKRDEMATKFSGRSRSVIDVLYHCGEENHWDLKETAFKAGWEAAVQNDKRVLQALQEASKRSTYEWTDGYDYFPSDHANEGRIALANELLKIWDTP